MVATDTDLHTDTPDPDDPVFALHRGGKMEISATVPLRNAQDLAMSYTPGVARVCEAIAADPALAHDYTWVSNTVAVVTDGTAVLGLGDIGPAAAMPVMEGKAVLFKQFGGVDASRSRWTRTDVDEIVETIVRLAPTFGGINLEDISAPRCFEIERRLSERLDIPVFHDDQHGTAVVVAGGADQRRHASPTASSATCGSSISGAGAAGVAITKILHRGRGRAKIAVVDRAASSTPAATDLDRGQAALAERRPTAGLTGHARGRAGRRRRVHRRLRRHGARGGRRADGAGRDRLRDGQPDPGGAPRRRRTGTRAVVATGRSDFPNQINNVLAFPGIFRGALDVRAHADHRGHEARGRRRDRRRSSATSSPRDVRHPVAVRPARRGSAVARARRATPRAVTACARRPY